MPVLVKMQKDYADEFDVYGFTVLSDKKWKQMQEVFKCIEFPSEYYFGTNEMLTFESVDEIMQCLKIVDLSLEAEKVLRKLFSPTYSENDPEFGFLPFEQMTEEISDEDYDRIFPDGN